MNRKNTIILISLLISLALIFLVLTPLWSSVGVLRQEVSQQKSRVSQLEKLLDKTEELETEYRQAEESVEKILLALPGEADFPFLLTHFANLAASSGLLMETIKFSEPARGRGALSGTGSGASSQSQIIAAGLAKMSLDMTLSGSYEALKGYLTALENSVRAMDLSSLKIVSQSGSQSELLADLGIFRFDLRMDIYYR